MARSGSSSPDSSISISSLLASCSLGSSTSSTRSGVSVEYKDKLYASASKALDAYIKDYDESLQSPLASTGKITIRSSSSHHCMKKRAPVKSEVKRKNHFSSTRRPMARDPDLLSLTTDDLLSFPSDGSLPLPQSYTYKQKVFETSIRQQGTFSKKHASLQSSQQAAPLKRKSRLNLLGMEDHIDFKDNLYRQSRKPEFNPHRTIRKSSIPYHNEAPPPYYLKDSSVSTIPKAYPRWLTSHKSDLSVSGITSVPEVNYPIWLKSYDLLSDSDNQSTCNAFKSTKTCSFPQTFENVRSTGSLGRLDSIRVRFHEASKDNGECEESTRKSFVKEPTNYLHETDLQHLNTSLQSDPTDVLLQKSAHSPDILYKELSNPLKLNGSPKTEDVLEAERSWEQISFAFKAPVPVLCDDEKDLSASTKSNLVQDYLNDCINKDSQMMDTFSGGNHHGPVEALKHMLFNLQTFQQDFNQVKTPEKINELKISKDTDFPLRSFDQEMFPVNRSLQKALHHLSRLKELVGHSSVKQDDENNQEN